MEEDYQELPQEEINALTEERLLSEGLIAKGAD